MRCASWVWAIPLPWLMACGADGARGSGVDTARMAIVGGTTDSLHTGVVGLAVSQRGLFVGHCSGTLIAPNLVLTARHCVAATTSTPDEHVTCGVAEFAATGDPQIFLASPSTVRPAAPDDPTFFRGKAIRALPSADVCGSDVALLILEGKGMPRTLATPIVPRVDVGASVGEMFAAEGYGYTDAKTQTGDGTRMRLDGASVRCLGGACSTLADILRTGEWLSVDARLCPGDSGGPALDAQGQVMGVASRAGGACDTAIYSDVAAFSELIVNAALDAAADGGYDPPAWAANTVARDSGTTGPSTLGSSCESACAGDLACYAATGKPPGVCVPRCRNGDSCPAGYTCSSDLGVCTPTRSHDEGCSVVPGKGRTGSAGGLVAVALLGGGGGLVWGKLRRRMGFRRGTQKRPGRPRRGGVPWAPQSSANRGGHDREAVRADASTR